MTGLDLKDGKQLIQRVHYRQKDPNGPRPQGRKEFAQLGIRKSLWSLECGQQGSEVKGEGSRGKSRGQIMHGLVGRVRSFIFILRATESLS